MKNKFKNLFIKIERFLFALKKSWFLLKIGLLPIAIVQKAKINTDNNFWYCFYLCLDITNLKKGVMFCKVVANNFLSLQEISHLLQLPDLPFVPKIEKIKILGGGGLLICSHYIFKIKQINDIRLDKKIIIEQIISILDSLYINKIIHCDISFSNIGVKKNKLYLFDCGNNYMIKGISASEFNNTNNKFYKKEKKKIIIDDAYCFYMILKDIGYKDNELIQIKQKIGRISLTLDSNG